MRESLAEQMKVLKHRVNGERHTGWRYDRSDREFIESSKPSSNGWYKMRPKHDDDFSETMYVVFLGGDTGGGTYRLISAGQMNRARIENVHVGPSFMKQLEPVSKNKVPAKVLSKMVGHPAYKKFSNQDESREFSEAAGKKLKIGTSTFEVVRTYKTKMDATGPIGRDFIRTIPSGGGGAIAKKLSGGHQPGYYFVAMSATGKPDGRPMWMSPGNYKRAMRYESVGSEFSEAGGPYFVNVRGERPNQRRALEDLEDMKRNFLRLHKQAVSSVESQQYQHVEGDVKEIVKLAQLVLSRVKSYRAKMPKARKGVSLGAVARGHAGPSDEYDR